MAKIIAPNKDYNGVTATIKFNKGVGETSNPYFIEWFKTHGYTVEEEKPVKEDKKAKDDKKDPVKTTGDADKKPDEPGMTPDEASKDAAPVKTTGE